MKLQRYNKIVELLVYPVGQSEVIDISRSNELGRSGELST